MLPITNGFHILGRRRPTPVEVEVSLLYSLPVRIVVDGVIGALANMGEAQVPLSIQKKLGRPATAGKGMPYLVIAIDDDGISQTKFPNAALNVRLVLRKGELWRVHADDGQSMIFIAFMPGLYVRQGADTVHTGVVPEVNQHHAPAQLADG